jgi:hypothetical protein
MKDNYEFPFQEKIEDGFYIRKFDSETDEEEFVWHRDKEDRIIECTHQTNWMFQKENQLPEKFDKKIFIEKMVWHRVIKGDGNLELKIKKLI